MELPAEVLIHNELLGVKGGEGTLLQVSPDGYYEINCAFGERVHRTLFPIQGTVLISARAAKTHGRGPTWRSNVMAAKHGRGCRSTSTTSRPCARPGGPASPTRWRRRAIAEDAGASGITVHLRVDRRHIQDPDVERLRGERPGQAEPGDVDAPKRWSKVALRVRPEQVTLVPERPEEVTTEGGLDLGGQAARIAAAAERLSAAGIAVSLFVDPDAGQVAALCGLAARGVGGFEINTDAYTRRADAEAVRRAREGASRRGARPPGGAPRSTPATA